LSLDYRGMRLSPVGPRISLADAGVSLGGQSILRGLDLEAQPGEVMGVAGPNGSGKTTLLRLLATLVPPTQGAGSVLGARLGTSEVYAIRRRIGLIGHTPAVIGALSLQENLEHATRLAGEDPARVANALRVVGLDEAAGRRADTASFGMLRRTEVARLLITEPTLLLLDEAFSGLDLEAQELIDALLARTVEKGGVGVMVSHDPGRLAQRVGRVMMLHGGRLQASA
jgi:ABC-type multidrug transport system ATPase subunit